ncbi:MAG: PucR family transcriptional regulator [Clostridium sp.]|nr:PucR family transcriptional regulator [Clostridium sp.]
MICSSLSTMIKNPVILLDQFWNVLHYTALPNDPCSMKDLLELKPNESFLDSAFLDTLPLAFETLKKPITRQVQVKGESICSVIMPVNIGATHHGYIFVWNTFKDLVEIDYIALENAAMSFALERTRTKELDRTKNRIRRDFFDELLSGKITNQENLQYLCDLHGLNSNLFYTPMVVELRLNIHSDNDLVLNKQQEDSTIRQSVHTLEDYGISKSLIFHVFHQYRKIIILMGTSPKDNLINLDDMKNLGNEIINTLEKEITDSSFHLGIGRTSTSLLEIEKSFIEAKEALRLVQKSSDAKKVCHFEDFVVHHFLEENISEIEMRKFFHNALGPIYQYDKKYSSELISTLETWISHHFNVAETARALFTHRNTVLYRMDRISTILQSDLKNADEILKYQLALKIYHLLGLN